MDNSNPSVDTTIVAPLGDKHTHTVIFLHGREDFGSDLAEYFFDSKSSDGLSLAEIFPSTKWVFPTAKIRYSARYDALFSGGSFAEALKDEEFISQWFDVWDIKTPEEKEDLMIPGLRESILQIVGVIMEEVQTIPIERIILGGISQGCATAILALLWSNMRLGGFVGICSWLPFEKRLVNTPDAKGVPRLLDEVLKIPEGSADGFQPPGKTITTRSKNITDQTPAEQDLAASPGSMSIHSGSGTPVFLSHSRDDGIVPFSMGETLCKRIQSLGFNVTWKEYQDGGHWIHPEKGVDDIATFLHNTLSIPREDSNVLVGNTSKQ